MLYFMRKYILLTLITYCSLAFAADKMPASYSDGYLKRGYRGFVEGGAGANVKDGQQSFFVSTTHGRQFSRWYYMGGGISFTRTNTKQYYREPNNPEKHYYNDPHNLFHAFMDMRLTVPNRSRFYPYADLKLGLGGLESIWYLHSQIGARYSVYRNLGISAGVYYTKLNSWAASGPLMGAVVSFDF